MTVSDVTRRTSVVGTAAAGQEVSFDFPVASTDEIYVKTRVTATGAESAYLTEDTDYSVTLNADGSGTVTMVAAVAATSEIHVSRISDRSQLLDLAQGGSFNAELLEDALDKNTRQIIDNTDSLNRTMTIPTTDDPTLDMELPNSVDRAGAYLYFDATGLPTAVNAVDSSLVVISPKGETLLAIATSAGWLTELGVSAFAQTMLDDAAATNVLTTLGVSAFAKTLLDDAAATNVLTTLGVSTFIKTLIDDASATVALATLGAHTADDILVHDDEVLSYENNVLTWKV
jgi:hypothetical protein